MNAFKMFVMTALVAHVIAGVNAELVPTGETIIHAQEVAGKPGKVVKLKATVYEVLLDTETGYPKGRPLQGVKVNFDVDDALPGGFYPAREGKTDSKGRVQVAYKIRRNHPRFRVAKLRIWYAGNLQTQGSKALTYIRVR